MEESKDHEHLKKLGKKKFQYLMNKFYAFPLKPPYQRIQIDLINIFGFALVQLNCKIYFCGGYKVF